ncbi:TerC family protein [Virgibacillus sp. MSP4-1]|uniref:TerC family protein n=1 Tax=Virgibacillus sp. MSP4-1 TaxID=2700081 RepID=UPI00039F8F79|nr:TerC family protein [Virgibacillus sp. MSP4-1]QHS21692.1 TerC family protein [Virgibacillus sp. MSP4-1]
MEFLDFEFIKSIIAIIGIDLVLGGDNAIVIALASRNLPLSQRNKAIIWGTGLAICIRILLTAVALYLLQIPFLQFVGGLLLVYIAIHLLTDDGDDPDIKGSDNLLSAIKTIVFADVVMGFDNVIALAGASGGNIILVIIGLLISVPIIIWGSKIILFIMEKFPVLVYIGASILAYTASEMILGEERLQPIFEQLRILHYILPIVMILFVIITGYNVDQRKIKTVK